MLSGRVPMARSKLPWTLDLVSPYLTEWSYRAEIVKVESATVLEVRIDLGFNVSHTVKVRLIGVTPSDSSDTRKLAHRYAFDWMRRQRGEILMRSEKDKDKGGLWLAEIWSRDQSRCLNQDLLVEGLGTPRKMQ